MELDAARRFFRSSEALDGLKPFVPHLEKRTNPNIILVPTRNGRSSLDVMLAGLLPDHVLEQHNLERRRTTLPLLLHNDERDRGYGPRAREAFSHYIWSKLCPRARLSENAFAASSPLRLLAGDTRFWENRLYRLALDRRDQLFEPTEHEEDDWESVDSFRKKMLAAIPDDDHHLFTIARPLTGGDIWDVYDPDQREETIQAAIDGAGVMDSLNPVIELLHRHRAHEDFSDQNSWIKEDFERSFYSKRARLKVDLIETIDEAPAYDVEPNAPYEHVLFRDVIAVLDRRERRLALALRLGKNASTIARESNLRGHASISRRIRALKSKISRLLD